MAGHAHAPSVDIHAHFFPGEYLKLIEREGSSYGAQVFHPEKPRGDGGLLVDGTRWTVAHKIVDIGARVRAMDKQGVQTQALSLTAPMVYWATSSLGQKLSAAYNDGLGQAHDDHPDRFVGLAILPMQDPKLALKELNRAAKIPGVRGVYMATRVLEKELSDPSFFDVFERCEELGLPIFLHPIKVVDPARLKAYYLNNLIGNPTESAIAASHLIYGGVLDRFKKLVVCLPHAGGSFPYLIGRIDHGWEVRPECKHLKNRPMSYLRRFYYDTITHAAKPLGYLIDLVGADRVMLGSDYCFDMGYERPVEIVTKHKGLSAKDRDLILGGNAVRLLGLKTPKKKK